MLGRSTPRLRTTDAAAAAPTTAESAAEVPSDEGSTSAQNTEAATEAPAEGADAADLLEESSSTDEAPYGEGSHAPLEDGSQPDGFPIKGNADSMLYHSPGTAFYDRTVAEAWFATPEAAEAAGFALPPSQAAEARRGCHGCRRWLRCR